MRMNKITVAANEKPEPKKNIQSMIFKARATMNYTHTYIHIYTHTDTQYICIQFTHTDKQHIFSLEFLF